jgi:branched-subunit amino acid ABC-type transport system permease component
VSAPRGLGSAFEFDTFTAAVGLALVSGSLALLAPYLADLTATLAALAVAGWVMGRVALRPTPRPSPNPGRTLGLASVATGGVAFLFAPEPFRTVRALCLALLLLPLWWAERRRPGSIPGPR